MAPEVKSTAASSEEGAGLGSPPAASSSSECSTRSSRRIDLGSSPATNRIPGSLSTAAATTAGGMPIK